MGEVPRIKVSFIKLETTLVRGATSQTYSFCSFPSGIFPQNLIPGQFSALLKDLKIRVRIGAIFLPVPNSRRRDRARQSSLRSATRQSPGQHVRQSKPQPALLRSGGTRSNSASTITSESHNTERSQRLQRQRIFYQKVTKGGGLDLA
jgi:hypothetical protein